MEYSKLLLEFRARHRLSQCQLASILGVHPNMVYRYEIGECKPSAVNRLRFAAEMKKWEDDNND